MALEEPASPAKPSTIGIKTENGLLAIFGNNNIHDYLNSVCLVAKNKAENIILYPFRSTKAGRLLYYKNNGSTGKYTDSIYRNHSKTPTT